MNPGSDLYGEYASCINCGHYEDVYNRPPIELKEIGGGKAQRGPYTRKGKVKL